MRRTQCAVVVYLSRYSLEYRVSQKDARLLILKDMPNLISDEEVLRKQKKISSLNILSITRLFWETLYLNTPEKIVFISLQIKLHFPNTLYECLRRMHKCSQQQWHHACMRFVLILKINRKYKASQREYS